MIRKITIPSGVAEDMFFDTGAYTIGMPMNCPHCLPYEIFPEKGISFIEFSEVTFFSGGVNSVKELLMDIMLSVLLEDNIFPKGMHQRCLGEYLKMCYVFGERQEIIKYIRAEDIEEYIDKKYARIDINKRWSIFDYLDKEITENSFIIMKHPERYLSIYEQFEFADYLYLSAKDSGNQFLISTNSPILLGVKNAIIYDFDNMPILPNKWSHSPIVREYQRGYEDIVRSHQRKKQ